MVALVVKRAVVVLKRTRSVKKCRPRTKVTSIVVLYESVAINIEIA